MIDKWYAWKFHYGASTDTLLYLLAPILKQFPMFHFFVGEPWASLVVRINTNEFNAERIERAFTELGLSWEQDEYEDEYEQFGVWWPDVRDFFTVGSKLALTTIILKKEDLRNKLGPLANPRKLIHCWLDQMGFAYEDEASFYRDCTARSDFLATEGRAGRIKRDYVLPENAPKIRDYGWML